MKSLDRAVFVVSLLLFSVSIVPGVSLAVPPVIAKKIVVATPTEPDTLDLNSTKLDSISVPIAENITERLIAVAPDGKLVPGLAVSWKRSPDGKELDFFLRKGVKFHNGDSFTAKDVQFSHERGLKNSMTYARVMRYLETFSVVDDYHVKFKFKDPDAAVLFGRPVSIESKSYYDKVGEEKFVKEPIGTGPYRFVKWEPGQFIEMKANEDYWGEKPAVKEARFVFVKEDTTRVAMLKAGEADMIIECPFPLVREVESAGYKTARLPVAPSISLQFHTSNPKVPWYDKRVRLAMAMAIDNKVMVENLFQGIPTRPARINSWELGFDKDLKPYPFDPIRAKKLLAEAGYPNGFEMPLYYMVGRAAGQKETTEMVANYLSVIGVRANVEGIEATKLMAKLRDAHKTTEAVFACVGTVPTANFNDPIAALEIGFYSKSPLGLYQNPKLDAVIEKARGALDDKKRAVFIKDAFRIIHDDVPTTLLWANVTVYAMQKNLNFTPTVKASHPMVFLKDIKPTK